MSLAILFTCKMIFQENQITFVLHIGFIQIEITFFRLLIYEEYPSIVCLILKAHRQPYGIRIIKLMSNFYS